MTSPHNVVQLNAQRGTQAEGVKLPTVIIKLRDRCAAHLQKLLNQMFDKIDDALFARAEKAGTNSDQAVFFDAMRELRLKKTQIIGLCIQGLSEDFRFTVAAERKRAEVRFDAENLSLIQHDVLEEQVAFDNMIKRVRGEASRELEHLSLRLDAVIPGVRIDEMNNPLGPDRVVANFGKACRCVEIDIKPRLVLFKVFEKAVLSHLKPTYEAANKYLIEQGVMPDLRSVSQTSRQSPSSASPAGSRIIDAASGQVQEVLSNSAPGISNGVQDTFALLRDLLGRMPGRGGSPMRGDSMAVAGSIAGSGSASNLPDISQVALLSVLSGLQQRVGRQSGVEKLDYADLLEKAMPGAPEGQGKKIGALDQDVMNLVSMLFEYILSDRNLQPQVKALIGRLQIPILKVAIVDRTFFSKADHSARRLLNELASSAIGWTSGKEGDADSFLAKIEGIVDVLINQFDADLSMFDQILEDFLVFAEGERKRRRLVEQRTHDAEVGKAKSEAARRHVQEALNALLDNVTVPALTLKVLHEGWSSYLVLLQLKGAAESAEWHDALTTAKGLIDGTAQGDLRDVLEVSRIRTLVDQLRKGLKQTAFQPFEQEKLLRKIDCLLMETSQARIAHAVDLDQEYLGFDEGKDGDALQVETVNVAVPLPLPQLPESESLAEPESHAETEPTIVARENTFLPEPLPSLSETLVAEDRAPVDANIRLVETETPAMALSDEIEATEVQTLVDGLRVGCWVEICESDDRRYRAKLAAIIQTTGKYIFVNRMGVKVEEKTRMTLALALHRKEIALLDDSMLFDRALEAVIGNLRGAKA